MRIWHTVVCVIFLSMMKKCPFLLVTEWYKSFHLCLCKTRCLFLAKMPWERAFVTKWGDEGKQRPLHELQVYGTVSTTIISEGPWVKPISPFNNVVFSQRFRTPDKHQLLKAKLRSPQILWPHISHKPAACGFVSHDTCVHQTHHSVRSFSPSLLSKGV